MRRIRNPLSPETIRAQRSASDPTASVWVRANAGSGKTHVLTQRVLRLMLGGVPAASILCLTYTKAAAAEMRKRVADRLGRWAVLDEAGLVAELTELGGETPAPAMRLRARTLFAHALESPGGLRIQTIHAFCESVLHRFPVEAGVPFDFTVIEDHERADMVLRAREQVLSAGLNGDPQVAEAVETLFDLLSDFKINDAIETSLAGMRKLRVILADPARAKRTLRAFTGYDASRDRARVLADIVADCRWFAAEERADVLRICGCKPGGTRFEDKLGRVADRPLDAIDLLELFLTKDRRAPERFPAKALVSGAPALAERLREQAQRLEQFAGELRLAELIARSDALLEVLGAISRRYEDEKRSRALLDFDDLIEHAIALLGDEGLGPWVRYKLDAGIDHLLVDESQDTNFEQWAVVRALVAEYFAGDGAVTRPRTVFAVGDEKQSIFSFQGAAPELFVRVGEELAELAGPVRMTFRRQRLQTSFRTLPNVLDAVDRVFGDARLQDAVLTDERVEHRTERAEAGGRVTLWPPVREAADEPPGDAWPLEPPPTDKSAVRQVAEGIAREIGQWVRGGRLLGPRGRPVRFDDVLILVQTRNALFREVIRALHHQLIPTPGADRLEVTGHIAVLDLMALGDVLLNTDDDLQLAALLRSPLFDLSEDDLLAVAQPRGQHQSLWRALEHSQILPARAAYDELRALRARLDVERPFNLYAEVLYASGGLARFHRRFGLEVDDVFAEFLDLALDHERSGQPGLQAFLAAMRSRDVEIRRELGEGSGGVRVMTVHGAKGLEAPIVILADAAQRPLGSQMRSAVQLVTDARGPMLIHASARDDHTPATEVFRREYEERQEQEYWRKLYVGMTRAEDELYVTGALTKAGRIADTWYETIRETLEPLADVAHDAEGAATAIAFPREAGAAAAAGLAEAGLQERGTSPLILGPVAAPAIIEVIRPSLAEDTPRAERRTFETAAGAIRDAETARREGLALHALLNHLPGIAPADRRAVAHRAVETLLPGAVERHARVADKALSILDNPEFAAIFGPQSRGEVPFLVDLVRDRKPVRLVGRMDRLIVVNDTVTIIDFKSDANPQPNRAPPAYVAQVGLYALAAAQLFPRKHLEAAILWTELESLLKLDRFALAEATRGIHPKGEDVDV